MKEQLEQLTQGLLCRLVKLTQRYSLRGSHGDWSTYLQSTGKAKLGKDPQRHDAETTRGYLLSLLQPTYSSMATASHTCQHSNTSTPSTAQPQPAQPADQAIASTVRAQSSSTASPEWSSRVIRRCIRLLQRTDKEQRLRATSVPRMPHSAAENSRVQLATAAVQPSSESTAAQQQQDGADDDAAPGAGPTQHHADIHPVWQLVQATRSHARYGTQYSFPSALPGWARVKRRRVLPNGSSMPTSRLIADASHAPRLLALDCEMVKTVDDPAALANLSLVDEQGKVVYKALVRPREQVMDYNTELTGLTAADFEGATTTRSQARCAVKELLLEPWQQHRQMCVLVGHGLHNDLLALRLDYQPVIDTALIFSYRGLPGCTPSLSDLHQAVLGHDMPTRITTGKHDSAEDAWAAMQLVLHELRQPNRTAPLPPPATKVSKEDLRKLLVHGIPASLTEQQLLAVFEPLLITSKKTATHQQQQQTAAHAPLAETDTSDSDSDSDSSSDEDLDGNKSEQLVTNASSAAGQEQRSSHMPCLTELPTFETQPGIMQKRAVLVFKHAGELNAAFKALSGVNAKDVMGRPAKTITLPDGRTIRLRKNAGHNGFQFSQSGTDATPFTGHKRIAPESGVRAQKKGRNKQ